MEDRGRKQIKKKCRYCNFQGKITVYQLDELFVALLFFQVEYMFPVGFFIGTSVLGIFTTFLLKIGLYHSQKTCSRKVLIFPLLLKLILQR